MSSNPRFGVQHEVRMANPVRSFSGFMSKGLWQNMFKRGSTAGSAMPGTVSSTMATGILPQFSSGHAAASLSPALGTSVSGAAAALSVSSGSDSLRATPSGRSKSMDLGDGPGGGGAPLNPQDPGPVPSISVKRGENLPPSTRASLQDELSGMSVH